MARTTRKNLLLNCDQALAAIGRLDLYLMNMDEMAAGRQPAIGQMKAIMIESHAQTERLWRILRSQL